MRIQFGDVRFQFNTYGYSHGDAASNNQLIKASVSSMMNTVKQHTQLELTYAAETVKGSKDLFYRISPKDPSQNLTEFDTSVSDFMQDFATNNNRIQNVTVVAPKSLVAEA